MLLPAVDTESETEDEDAQHRSMNQSSRLLPKSHGRRGEGGIAEKKDTASGAKCESWMICQQHYLLQDAIGYAAATFARDMIRFLIHEIRSFVTRKLCTAMFEDVLGISRPGRRGLIVC